MLIHIHRTLQTHLETHLELLFFKNRERLVTTPRQISRTCHIHLWSLNPGASDTSQGGETTLWCTQSFMKNLGGGIVWDDVTCASRWKVFLHFLQYPSWCMFILVIKLTSFYYNCKHSSLHLNFETAKLDSQMQDIRYSISLQFTVLWCFSYPFLSLWSSIAPDAILLVFSWEWRCILNYGAADLSRAHAFSGNIL